MCGRFNVTSDPLSQLLMDLVGLPHPGPDNYNAAPTQDITVLRMDADGDPELVRMRWWLTPYWAKEMSAKYAMFNAKSETAHKSPAFREPYKKRRCVVPVSGFYEWAKQAQGPKLPYLVAPREAAGLLLAGLWDRWRNPETDVVLESFTILTTKANAALAFVHNRQPVMLSPEDAKAWLDPTVATDELTNLFASALPMPLHAIPVSTHVNNARHTDERCMSAIAEPIDVDEDAPLH